MSSTELPGFLDRLQRTAATARDLLAHSRVPRWEVFAKASSVREVTVAGHGPEQVLELEETGVAVRTTRNGRSGFAAASGMGASAARAAADGALVNEQGIAQDPLPPARLLGHGTPPPAPPVPAAGWAAHVTEQLARTVAGISEGRLRLVRTTVHEGRFAWLLTTGDGFVAAHEGASCSLLTEAVLADGGAGVWRDWSWVPDPSALDLERLASRLGNRLLLTGGSATPEPGVRDLLLHSEVAAHLLAAVAPLFLATPAEHDPLPALLDRSGRLTAPSLSIADDGAGNAGPVTGPCDGEGHPAARVLVLEQGVPRHRLATFAAALRCDEVPRGGAVRHSYRDYPVTGFRNLLVDVSEGLPPATLLTEANHAVYLLRLLAPVEVDFEHDEVRLITAGVALARGRVHSWHPVVEVRARLGRLLRRIGAVGTDLEWYQTAGGCVGTPSLLIRHQPVR